MFTSKQRAKLKSLASTQKPVMQVGKEGIGEVERFWREGDVNPESNVSFGEGGAGTFSDGKLNTGVKDRTGRKRFVLESFVRFGAGEDILYDSRPHIGTDVLRRVIVNMRKEMQQRGCQFRFHTKLISLSAEGGRLRAVRLRIIKSLKKYRAISGHGIFIHSLCRKNSSEKEIVSFERHFLVFVFVEFVELGHFPV